MAITSIRPEVAAFAHRWREMGLAIALAAFGLWLVWLGGYLLVPLGAASIAMAAGWALLALRRVRFTSNGDAPGLVEVDEGQIAYFGPQTGGAVGLPDLVELRLVTMRGRRLWRLKQSDGQALLIPIEAAGADRLFDAFASLPGMDTAALVAALTSAPAQGGTTLTLAAEAVLVWQRRGAGLVRR